MPAAHPSPDSLEAWNDLVAACDKHHHFYHYKSSYLHLCHALYLHETGDLAGARKHYEAAIFQDHLNEAAKAGLNSTSAITGIPYDRHVSTDAIAMLAAFESSLGWEADHSMEKLKVREFEEALRICNERHHRYHRHASDAHLGRGRWHEQHGSLDLAIADYSKALDLNGKNQVALRARAALYRQKENHRMAEADEARLEAV